VLRILRDAGHDIQELSNATRNRPERQVVMRALRRAIAEDVERAAGCP
jgi:hypothetical protein